jgi:hypothetical protein
MKKQLNEELSRINGMMKMISEESFEDTSKPSETIINDVKQTLRYFLNQDNPQADETEVDADGGWFTIDGGDNKYIKYYFDINVKSHQHTTPGYGYMDNADPGYPDETEPMDFDITISQIEVGETVHNDEQWIDNVEFKGSDFTDFAGLTFKDGQSGEQWLSNTFNERILETDYNQEEEINNINENKKMGKKITITESQLQRLMERKHSYTDNTPEGEMEEQESFGPDSAIVNTDEEMGEEMERTDGGKFDEGILEYVLKLIITAKGGAAAAEQFEEILNGEIEGHNPNAVELIVNVLHDTMGGGGIFSEPAEEIIHGIINSLSEYESDDESSEENDDEDVMMNESIKAIKSNFKRFL